MTSLSLGVRSTTVLQQLPNSLMPMILDRKQPLSQFWLPQILQQGVAIFKALMVPCIRATRVRILSVKINQGCPILSKYDFRLRVFFAEILRQPRFCKTVQKSDREESSETKNRI